MRWQHAENNSCFDGCVMEKYPEHADCLCLTCKRDLEIKCCCLLPTHSNVPCVVDKCDDYEKEEEDPENA